MLNRLDRNIRSVNMMLDMVGENPLKFKQKQKFWIIQTPMDQQRMMYTEKINRWDDRSDMNLVSSGVYHENNMLCPILFQNLMYIMLAL